MPTGRKKNHAKSQNSGRKRQSVHKGDAPSRTPPHFFRRLVGAGLALPPFHTIEELRGQGKPSPYELFAAPPRCTPIPEILRGVQRFCATDPARARACAGKSGAAADNLDYLAFGAASVRAPGEAAGPESGPCATFPLDFRGAFRRTGTACRPLPPHSPSRTPDRATRLRFLESDGLHRGPHIEGWWGRLPRYTSFQATQVRQRQDGAVASPSSGHPPGWGPTQRFRALPPDTRAMPESVLPFAGFRER